VPKGQDRARTLLDVTVDTDRLGDKGTRLKTRGQTQKPCLPWKRLAATCSQNKTTGDLATTDPHLLVEYADSDDAVIAPLPLFERKRIVTVAEDGW